jgi:hypothetical protein
VKYWAGGAPSASMALSQSHRLRLSKKIYAIARGLCGKFSIERAHFASGSSCLQCWTKYYKKKYAVNFDDVMDLSELFGEDCSLEPLMQTWESLIRAGIAPGSKCAFTDQPLAGKRTALDHFFPRADFPWLETFQDNFFIVEHHIIRITLLRSLC